MERIWTMLSDPNMQWIFLGCTLLGLSSGVIGCFSYLRKQSLMGDTLAHAALPGICIAFMLTGVKSIGLFLIGAGIAGIIATFGIGYITRNSKLKQDAAMGIVLSGFFGLGIVLLTLIQHGSYGNQAGLDKFMFGQAASMIASDVIVMTIVCASLITICTLLFKQFKLISFDPGFARGLGYPVAFLEQLMMLLVVVAVVAGIQAVGVVLVAALLITPAVSARYWTNRLGVMVILSGVFGAVSGAVGTWISASVFGISILFGPQRGIVAKRLLRKTVKQRFRRENELHLEGNVKKEAAL
jgi:manganese/zinc/iron transport system permease protein